MSLAMMTSLPIVAWSAAEEGFALAGASIACPQGGAFRTKTRMHRASCTGAHGEQLPVADDAWQRWRFAFFAPLALGMGALMLGAQAKRRRDLAREALSGLF
ncbi:MAG: hypothetical protein EOP08_05205 [Proteobacteria bacterium]|nr:MAG: hypothetical protein EOP08_05205 [Pseudomonadota bacterium]